MGTSTDYAAPPTWGALKSSVTHAGGQSLGPTKAGELVREHVGYNGGARRIASGGGILGAGRTSQAIGRNLGGFISQVGGTGLADTLPLASGSAVCLFSGGLDSLVGAIDWLEDHADESLVLVGHHDPKITGPNSDQKNVFGILQQHYPQRLSPVLVGVGQMPSGKEMTLRSRSLLFVALGVLVAESLGDNVPVLVPENGTIALNVPLTPSRRGSCSTRTAHPYYLTQLQKWLDGIELKHPLSNPLLPKSKGEVVAECKNSKVLATAAMRSVSCAKRGHTKTWKNRSAKGCGRCMPCVYRRAALHKAGLDQETYGVDVCRGDVDVSDRDSESADDFRACISFLRRNPSASEIAKMLIANGPIPPLDAMSHSGTVQRAMEEIRCLFKDKATVEIKRVAGLARGAKRVT